MKARAMRIAPGEFRGTIAERPVMRKAMLLALAALAACSSHRSGLPRGSAADSVLEVRGAVKGGPFHLSASALRALPQANVLGQDPVTGQEASWQGVPLAVLVHDRVTRTKGADTVLVRTQDGAAVPIPIPIARSMKPVIANRADGAALAAMVLAWPNQEQIGLQTDPRQPLWWAHGVVALEIVDYQATLGRALVAPDGSPDAARVGAETFGARCVACHRLRGVGGQKGPDLTTVATRMSNDAFVRLLEKHPGWLQRGGETPGHEAAAELWAYLRAVAVAPRPEPRPGEPPGPGSGTPGGAPE
jgi:mono/diheme cytochrome c family protein